MKCPICGINHRKISVADVCYSRINNEWGHYIILCINMPGGTIEENIKKYNIPLFNFRHVKKLKEQMDEYIKGFKNENNKR